MLTDSTMVRFDIGGFKTGGRSLSKDLEAAELELDSEDIRDIHVDIELDREGDRILVQYDVSGTAHLICDRTTEPFAQEVQGTHSLLFVPHDRVESVTDGSDDILGFDPTDTVLDLTVPVRDTLLLAVPIRRIAPGAEDLDIPTSFGDTGQDIDPRWEVLRKLKEASTEPTTESESSNG